MARRWSGRLCDCVVVDLNTQHDYCAVDGADPVRNIETLVPALRQVVAWAKWYGAPVISSVESHRSSELVNDAHAGCCRDGSPGQRKIDFTVFPHSARIEVDNTLCCPLDLFRQYQQVLFRKRSDDLLGNPKADRFLNQLPASEFVLFGVGLESSIKALALTLLARHRNTTIVLDACGYWNKSAADLAVRQVLAKGAKLTTVGELLRRKIARGVRDQDSHSKKVPVRTGTKRRGRCRSQASPKNQPTESDKTKRPATLPRHEGSSRQHKTDS